LKTAARKIIHARTQRVLTPGERCPSSTMPASKSTRQLPRTNKKERTQHTPTLSPAMAKYVCRTDACLNKPARARFTCWCYRVAVRHGRGRARSSRVLPRESPGGGRAQAGEYSRDRVYGRARERP